MYKYSTFKLQFLISLKLWHNSYIRSESYEIDTNRYLFQAALFRRKHQYVKTQARKH